jgi:hypothetical protein
MADARQEVVGPMDHAHSAQAERTVTALQQSLARGVPMMIPGSLGTRRSATTPPVVYPELPPVFDRRRVEHEWEGGGAPDFRGADRPSWLRRIGRMLGL